MSELVNQSSLSECLSIFLSVCFRVPWPYTEESIPLICLLYICLRAYHNKTSVIKKYNAAIHRRQNVSGQFTEITKCNPFHLNPANGLMQEMKKSFPDEKIPHFPLRISLSLLGNRCALKYPWQSQDVSHTRKKTEIHPRKTL